ncbi:sigma factor-like helix-turn-helix DNA-binding protein [Micromonospora zamorensis]|uniref:sigma factor-like helix-turn-helix DNA-binding protein n=1 Tax=Micromonospora zamorensis TaxID=709883 RepID=UPI00340065F9
MALATAGRRARPDGTTAGITSSIAQDTQIYFQERSVAEVAEVLHVPPGRVKPRTSYALRALREALAGRELRHSGTAGGTRPPRRA